MKGDCLERMKEIPDKSVDLVLTDPPYGATACKWDSVIDFKLMWAELIRITKTNGVIALFGSEPFSSILRVSNLKMYKYDWVWDKSLSVGHLLAKHRPMQRTEQVSIFSNGGMSFGSKEAIPYYPVMQKMDKPRKFISSLNTSELVNKHTMKKDYVRNDYKEKYPTNIINISNANRANKLHPTQKPVSLMEYLVKTYTLENETVLDFTMGSGSTGVACKNLNRNFIGIERDDKYFEIAKDRIGV